MHLVTVFAKLPSFFSGQTIRVFKTDVAGKSAGRNEYVIADSPRLNLRRVRGRSSEFRVMAASNIFAYKNAAILILGKNRRKGISKIEVSIRGSHQKLPVDNTIKVTWVSRFLLDTMPLGFTSKLSIR